MKRLVDYISYDKPNIISLNSFDYDIQEKLKNLDGKKINECCCATCCDKSKALADCGCCPSCSNQMIYFYYESDIIQMLNNNATVQNILNLQKQFGNKFRYNGETPAANSIVLYFTENNDYTDNNGGLNKLSPDYRNAQNDPTLYELIQTLLKKYKLGYPVVLSKQDNTANIYFIRYTGTNGKEGSIKSSLLQMYNLLNSLDNEDEINWSQILDVSIDSVDDLYSFVILCSINLNDIAK